MSPPPLRLHSSLPVFRSSANVLPSVHHHLQTMQFSMNHAGRKKQIGIDNTPSTCSIMECCVSKFDRVACAPMVDKYTTLLGRAASIADRNAAATARASRKSGDGSKFGGTSTKTPAAPLNAAISAAASLMSASTRSQPRVAQVSPLRISRTTPRPRRGNVGAYVCPECRYTEKL